MSEAVAGAPAEKETPRFIRALKAMKDRRMAAMFLLALAAGAHLGRCFAVLPNSLQRDGR